MTSRASLIVAWLALLVFDTVTQLSFKLGSGGLPDVGGVHWLAAAIESPWVLAGIAAYLGSFFAWMLILRRLDLSFAFPLTALGYVTVLTASVLLLGETVNTQRWVGVGCIVFGFLFMLGDSEEKGASH